MTLVIFAPSFLSATSVSPIGEPSHFLALCVSRFAVIYITFPAEHLFELLSPLFPLGLSQGGWADQHKHFAEQDEAPTDWQALRCCGATLFDTDYLVRLVDYECVLKDPIAWIGFGLDFNSYSVLHLPSSKKHSVIVPQQYPSPTQLM